MVVYILHMITKHPPYLKWYPTQNFGLQYDAMPAMRGVKWVHVYRNRLGFYSWVSCIYTLPRIVNQALDCRGYGGKNLGL